MRFLLLPLLLAVSAVSTAAPRHDKDTLVNTRYQESETEKAAREFKEADIGLPPFPDLQSGHWFDIYVGNTYDKKPKILLDSISIAPDTSVRYVLNIESKQGYDNLSAEGLFCADTTFSTKESKRSSFKIFGYGDTVNKRWITPRNADWKPIGAILNSADPVRGVLYRAFCEDGKPGSAEVLRQRVMERSGKHSRSMTNLNKK
ncbi:CNP1-like family protein [Neisseria dumasiana]|uniref:Cryptic protein cnp1 n=1 Tax=Neisseria dumasiana TaxID=1931275 RepID=A0ABX3WLA6_9NEIS|nr:CNP1-like family protein [Neisseria dumasiana]OSI34693.1 cryptic protein cnp1 [Neisseria dumasiana]UOO85461.1 CNP1-like family protein [Neisseria dumasiana]